MPARIHIKDVKVSLDYKDIDIELEVWLDGKKEEMSYWLRKGDDLSINLLEEDKIRILEGISAEEIGLGGLEIV